MGYNGLLERIGQVNDLLCSKSPQLGREDDDERAASTRAKQLATLQLFAIIWSQMRPDVCWIWLKGNAHLPEDSVERTMCAQVREAIDYHLKIPAELVERRAEMGSKGQHVWAKARADNDYAAFAPVLEETFELNRRMADCIGYEEHPYDALMYRFEPGETIASLQPLFASLRQGLMPLLKEIGEKESPRVDFLQRPFPVDKHSDSRSRWRVSSGTILTVADSIDGAPSKFRLPATTFESRHGQRRVDAKEPVWYATKRAMGCMSSIAILIIRGPLATDLVGLYAVGGVSLCA